MFKWLWERFVVITFIFLMGVVVVLLMVVFESTVKIKEDKTSGTNWVEYEDTIYRLVPIFGGGK